jgi:hypothetical protein
MANKKRRNKPYRKNLGRYHFSRKDILIIEKIIKKYASAYDNKNLKQMPESNKKRQIKARTRRFADVHVEFGNWLTALQGSGILPSTHPYQADSIKFLPQEVGYVRFFKVVCKPGIYVEISPRKTAISAQRHYATGAELQAMNSTIVELIEFISSRQKAQFFSSVKIRK